MDKIAARLRQPIPAAPRALPKPRKSWQGFKVDNLLTDGNVTVTVYGCDSAGLNVITPEGTHQRIESPQGWTKVRRKRKKGDNP